jgi:GDP-L-fucose synthase
MDKKSRIYVAGHSGLLGSSLLRALSSEGYSGIIVRTRDELDLLDEKAVNDFFDEERPEYVFLAAGLTGGIIANKTYPADFFRTNISIQNNVFEAAHKYNVKNLVFYGSSCMYPKDSPQPMKEEYILTGRIEETNEAYALSKIAGVIACRAYNSQHNNQRFIALVPNSMFGPRDNFDPVNSHVLSALIGKFHKARTAGSREVVLWGSGKPRREFVFVDDVAEASIFAVRNAGRLGNRHYNVGVGKDYSISELAQLIAGIIGFEGEIVWDRTKPDGVGRKLLDSSRFRKMGWEPGTSLKDGLKKTCDWYSEQCLKGGWDRKGIVKLNQRKEHCDVK